ncbi:MAG: DUF2268 domain-containing putative Zn-dependent protease [Candidatus Saccharibacteria bacterium]
MKKKNTACLVFESEKSKLTIHVYPSVRNNPIYDLVLLHKLVEESYQKVAAILPIGEVDAILFESETYAIIPEYGFGAVTENKEALVLTLSPVKVDLSKSLEKDYPALVAHELHHAVRFQEYPYRNDRFSLLESVVFEGLAEVFQEELYPDSPLHINPEITDFDEWIRKMLAEDKNYDYNAWFFGSAEIPRWTGYSIGYYIVKRTLQDKKMTAADAVWMKAEEFIK